MFACEACFVTQVVQGIVQPQADAIFNEVDVGFIRHIEHRLGLFTGVLRLVGGDGGQCACPRFPFVCEARNGFYGHFCLGFHLHEEPSVLSCLHLADGGHEGSSPTGLQEGMHDVQLLLVDIADALPLGACHHRPCVHGVRGFGHEHHTGASLVQLAEAFGSAEVHCLGLGCGGSAVSIHGVVHAYYLDSVCGHGVFGCFSVRKDKDNA